MKLLVPTALFGLLSVACEGERVESVATDSGTAETAACTSVEGNLVQNPSFEIAPGGTLSGWKTDGKVSVVQRLGGAGHCGAGAEVSLPAASTSFPAYFGQDVRVDPPLPMGSKITATLMLRTLDADLDGSIEVAVVSGGYNPQGVTLNADGTWKQYSVEWTLTSENDGASLLSVQFASSSPSARRIGVDHVTFVVTRP